MRHSSWSSDSRRRKNRSAIRRAWPVLEHSGTERETETQRRAGTCPGPPRAPAVPLGFRPKLEFIQSKDVKSQNPRKDRCEVSLREDRKPGQGHTAGWDQGPSPTQLWRRSHLPRQPREAGNSRDLKFKCVGDQAGNIHRESGHWGTVGPVVYWGRGGTRTVNPLWAEVRRKI